MPSTQPRGSPCTREGASSEEAHRSRHHHSDQHTRPGEVQRRGQQPSPSCAATEDDTRAGSCPRTGRTQPRRRRSCGRGVRWRWRSSGRGRVPRRQRWSARSQIAGCGDSDQTCDADAISSRPGLDVPRRPPTASESQHSPLRAPGFMSTDTCAYPRYSPTVPAVAPSLTGPESGPPSADNHGIVT